MLVKAAPQEDTSGQYPDQPAGSTAVGCGRVGRWALSHVATDSTAARGAAWLSREEGGEDTEFLRKGPWFTADTEGQVLATQDLTVVCRPDLGGLLEMQSLRLHLRLHPRAPESDL